MSEPTKFLLTMEKVTSGTVRVGVHDIDPDHPDNTALVWECTVAQEWTQGAQKAALKATMTYLNSFVDLSGRGDF